ncbi:MAG: histidine triad nucleotide-binding protein [Elusimicrobia bacterium]|nr:MAG: histidine triad nucleotide-binding protein [Elusimicrobiota bacterium]
MSADCIFCKIVSGEIPAEPIFEDEDVLAFKDLHPVAPTHVLVIPKRHIVGLGAATDDDAAVLGKVQVAAAKIAADLSLKDFRVVTNNGRAVGQSVFHIHYHLLAGRRMNWPPG